MTPKPSIARVELDDAQVSHLRALLDNATTSLGVHLSLVQTQPPGDVVVQLRAYGERDPNLAFKLKADGGLETCEPEAGQS